MKKHAKYRILEMTDVDDLQKYYIVQYWEFFGWHTYKWVVKRHMPEPNDLAWECPTLDEAMAKLKECKAARTVEVVYSE